MPLNLGIYIYDNAEVLDFSGPFEVFSTAQRLAQAPVFHPFLVGETGGVVTARGGYRVLPSYSIADHPDIDVLIVVGGVHTAELQKPDVLRWLSKIAPSAKVVASVCTGVFLLAQSGVISDERVTTHWEDVADLRRDFPQLRVLENIPWVDEGRIVSSAGISAGIDMSLHLVRQLHSLDLALRTARQMEFNWNP